MASLTNQVIPTFPCTQCGLCCQHVYLADETRFLDRGDGICRHYSADSRQCTIYDKRPDICRVDRQYVQHYASLYSWEEFVALNLQVCRQLETQSKNLK
ncbi:YkgJ family cysteine cluster protein [Methylotuvimicrobium buryatense]|uniref:YkgJ family cysteine cluster protein n=1 Tax=Methylotuvimicrobium buryatense TaxID=95641 RepID=A0A4P9USW9_METBY|nr:YkgJ family cysteine cluster protein [Methylotuvimicrobium buryatense]